MSWQYWCIIIVIVALYALDTREVACYFTKKGKITVSPVNISTHAKTIHFKDNTVSFLNYLILS